MVLPSLRSRLLRGLLIACAPLPVAQAHVVLESTVARAGTSYKAVLRVTHGCAGSPVHEVLVHIPPGVRGAKPLAKPGWRIEIERRRLDTPTTAHGRTVGEDVAAIRFAGGHLPEGVVDEFVVFATLPAAPGLLAWPVSQLCEQGRIDWDELPAAGTTPTTPAPLLELLPADPHAGHAH